MENSTCVTGQLIRLPLGTLDGEAVEAPRDLYARFLNRDLPSFLLNQTDFETKQSKTTSTGMDLASSRQNLLKNLQELPNPSSSEALLLGRPSAVASSMATQPTSSLRKKNHPSVLQPKARVIEKSLEEAFELLEKSIVNKFTTGSLEDRRLSVTLMDKDGLVLLGNQFIDITPHYSLPTLVLALQTLCDEVCAKNPRKYPNPLLVRAIEVRYFNNEMYRGLPKIAAFIGGDEVNQDGKMGEFVQWKENMVSYWEIFRHVMLVGAEVDTIEVPILRVRTIEMITDWDGPHGIEVVGNGHAFGDTLVPKQLQEVESTVKELDEDNEAVHATARIDVMSMECTSMSPGSNRCVEDAGTPQDNNFLTADASKQRLSSDSMGEEQVFDGNNAGLTSYILPEQDIITEVDPSIPCIEEEMEKIDDPQSVTQEEINYTLNVGRSNNLANEWMTGPEYRNHSSHFGKHMEVARVGVDNSIIHIDVNEEMFDLHKIDTWAYYQRKGGDPVIRNLFKLDHVAFIFRPGLVQSENRGTVSAKMVPYRHITFAQLYPAEINRVDRYRVIEEAAEGFDLEDDDTYYPGESQTASKEPAPTHPFIMKARNRKERQAGLQKVVDGATNRKASAKQSTHLDSLSGQSSHGTGTSALTGDVITAVARIEAARTLSATSTPFVPNIHQETPPDNQLQTYGIYAETPTPQQSSPYDPNVSMYPPHVQGITSSTNNSLPGTEGMNALFTTQEAYNAYHQVGANDPYQQERYPEHDYNNFSTQTNTQVTGDYGMASFSSHQGTNGYDNTDGYPNNSQAVASYNMDMMPRNSLVTHMDDLRGINSSQNYLASGLNSRTQNGYGSSYMDNMNANQHQYGFNNSYAGMDFNNSLATAFNGNMNHGANNLQVPNYHPHNNRRGASRSRSRRSSRSRNHIAAQGSLPASQTQLLAQNQTQVAAAPRSVLTAEAPIFAPEFRFTTSVYEESLTVTAPATTEAQGEMNPFVMKDAGESTVPVLEATESTQDSDVEKPQQ